MIVAENCYNEMINATARSIKARVELYEGSTLLDTYTYDGALQSFTVERVGDTNKFFGYGICQKLTVKLRDRERAIHITKGQGMEVVVGVGCEYLYTCPIFFVDEITRDENTNDLTIVAYDALYRATGHTVSEVVVPKSYTLQSFATAAAAVLGMPIKIERKNLLDYKKCSFHGCVLNEDGSITSNLNSHYYSSVRTTTLNTLLFESKGKPFTLSVGKSLPNRYCAIVIYGTRTSGGSYQEANVLNSSSATIIVADDFTEISSVELRFNRSLDAITDTTTTVPYMQFEAGGNATAYEPYNNTFDVSYPMGANFSGSETIREALNDIAEATGTIYYMNNNWELTFKRLDVSGTPVLHIDKSKYFNLKSETNFRLKSIVSATELGDNVSVAAEGQGETQYLRDNAFLDIREDVNVLLEDLFVIVKDLTIAQFDCKWRGNFLLEIGDKISLTAKDNSIITSYLLNDTLTYNGGLVSNTQWHYIANQSETASNPSSIGDAIKHTYARVDKINNEITIVASTAENNAEAISNLNINTESISASVQQVKDSTNSALEGVNSNMATLTSRVNASMTADAVQLQIQDALNDGVSSVTTTTGFTFDENGLSVSKTGSQMTTQITEDGMTVYRDETAVLVANNTGVEAINLNASTYLIIGLNSRFEDYDGQTRTGCFWIG